MLETPRATSHIGFYRSGLTSPEHRRFITVGRDHLVQDTLEGLRKNAGRATKHHALFIGLRGMGKTHLLSLIEDEIVADAALSAHYLVVRFPEESLRTLSFADFLLGMIEILAAIKPEEPEWQTLLLRLRGEEDDTKIIDTLVPAIRRANNEHQRTLVIMLENMGEVFTRQMKSKRDIAALRKFLMESKNGCLLIGTATMSFDGLTSVDEPFYDFFDVQHLEHLTEKESTDLVRHTLEWEKRTDLLAKWDELFPRLIALYRMTGGSPRLTVMLASLIARDSVIEVRDQFRILLDQITPFFQDRLTGLAPQERALLETIATMRDQDSTPATIAARMRKKVTHTSALLKRLTDLRLLRSTTHPDDKRVRRYDISEGFFDLWLYMNVSRGARERLPFLLDFFASFYPSYLEREKKRAELFATASDGKKEADSLLALDTLSEVGPAPEKARSKVFLASAYIRTGHSADASAVLREAAAQPLDQMGTWIVQSAAAESYPDYLTEIQELISLWDEHRTGNLEGFVRRMRELGDQFTPHNYSRVKLEFMEAHLEEVPPGPDRTRLRLQIGSLHQGLAHWPQAEAQNRAALAECEAREDHPLLPNSLNDLALLLKDTNRQEEAEPLMRRALVITEQRFGPEHPNVADRLNNLATLLHDTNRLAESEPLMRRVISIFEKSLGENHPKVATSLNNLAQLLAATNRMAEAEVLMRRALAAHEKSYGQEHPDVARGLNNLATLLYATNRLPEAEKLIRRSLAIEEQSFGPDHPNVAIRLNNLAVMLKASNHLAEAEPLMRRALAIAEQSFGPDHPDVARDLNNLATLLTATSRLEEAEPLMRRALTIDEQSLGLQHPNVARDLNNLALLLKDSKRLAEAEPLMRRMVLILLRFTVTTGHPHPHLLTVLNNYAIVLKEWEGDEAKQSAILSLGPEAGMEEAKFQGILAQAFGGTGS